MRYPCENDYSYRMDSIHPLQTRAHRPPQHSVCDTGPPRGLHKERGHPNTAYTDAPLDAIRRQDSLLKVPESHVPQEGTPSVLSHNQAHHHHK